MSATAIFYDNKKMFARLFWIDWIARLWFIGGGIWSIWLIIRTVIYLQPGAQVPLTMPVNQVFEQWPGKAYYSGSPYVLQHTTVQFTQATMTVVHLAPATVIWLGIGDIAAALMGAALAYCVFLLAWNLRNGRPFAATLSRLFVAGGLILGIGSTVSSVAKGIGQMTAMDIADTGKYQSLQIGSPGTLLEFTPLFIAGLLFALAGVFRYGASLQRETDGLV
jgi:hypothetical protein